MHSPADLELVCVQVGTSHPFYLCTVYIPPSASLSYFESVLSFFSDILSANTPCILCGDFNFPTICWDTLCGNTPLSSSFCDFIFNWNLTQHISEATYLKGNILDLILTNFEHMISNLSITQHNPFIQSDHFMITFKLAQNIVQPTPREIKLGFNYSQADWDGLYSYLLDTDFSTCLNSESIEFVWNTIKGTIHDAMHLFIPRERPRSTIYLRGSVLTSTIALNASELYVKNEGHILHCTSKLRLNP